MTENTPAPEIPPKKNDVPDWNEEILGILNGQRDGLLIKYGSISKYIEARLQSSEDESSRDRFYRALEGVVWSWSEGVPREKEYFLLMIELIGTYTPSGGFRKLIRFIEYWKNSIHSLENKFGYDSNADLLRRGIGALGRYFNVSPERTADDEEKSAFRYYVDLLERQLQEPGLVGFCAVLLLKSFIIESGDRRIKKAISFDPESLYEITSYIFSRDRQHKLNEELSTLTPNVFSLGGKALDLYISLLESRNINVDFSGSDLVLHLPKDETLSLDLAGKAVEHFLKRKYDIHLLPALLENVQRSSDQYHNKILEIFSRCQKEGREVIRLFRTELQNQNVVKEVFPEAYSYAVRIRVRLEKVDIHLICGLEYLEEFLEVSDSEVLEFMRTEA